MPWCAFDVMILDYELLDMTGAQLAQEIRALEPRAQMLLLSRRSHSANWRTSVRRLPCGQGVASRCPHRDSEKPDRVVHSESRVGRLITEPHLALCCSQDSVNISILQNQLRAKGVARPNLLLVCSTGSRCLSSLIRRVVWPRQRNLHSQLVAATRLPRCALLKGELESPAIDSIFAENSEHCLH